MVSADHGVAAADACAALDHGHHEQNVLLGIFTFLAIGAAVKHWLAWLPLPYTVLLMMLGMGLGGGLVVFQEQHCAYYSTFWYTIENASKMDAHLMLFTFLPPLIFESAFDLDLTVFRHTRNQAVLLATLGITVCSVLTAAFAMHIFRAEGLQFSDAVFFGAIASATDPVAVVALLKELGAPKELGHLIEGESLFNDGTAMVIFNVVRLIIFDADNFPKEAGPAVLHVAYLFFHMAVLGMLFGGLCGWLAVAWISRVFNDALVEITVTISFSFLCFFVAEDVLGMSGVLAVVAYGLYLNANRTRISPEVEHFLHEFWGLTGYLANTVVFLLVGVKAVTDNISLLKDGHYWGNAAIVFVMVNLVRAFAVFLLSPALRRMGVGIDFPRGVVMVWGGLRGAVGLALGLVAVDLYKANPPGGAHSPAVGSEIMFYTTIVVVGSLAINGVTMKPVVQYFGLDGIPRELAAELEVARHDAAEDVCRLKAPHCTAIGAHSRVLKYCSLPSLDRPCTRSRPTRRTPSRRSSPSSCSAARTGTSCGATCRTSRSRR